MSAATSGDAGRRRKEGRTGKACCPSCAVRLPPAARCSRLIYHCGQKRMRVESGHSMPIGREASRQLVARCRLAMGAVHRPLGCRSKATGRSSVHCQLGTSLIDDIAHRPIAAAARSSLCSPARLARTQIRRISKRVPPLIPPAPRAIHSEVDSEFTEHRTTTIGD